MIDLEQIRSIVDTYDLSPRLSSRIFRTAAHRIEERGIVSFDEAYSLIAALIEKWQMIHQQLHTISLDSRDFLHETIGEEDKFIKTLFDETKQLPNIAFKM